MNAVSQVALVLHQFLSSRLEQTYKPLRQLLCNQQSQVVEQKAESDVVVRKLNAIQCLLSILKGFFWKNASTERVCSDDMKLGEDPYVRSKEGTHTQHM